MFDDPELALWMMHDGYGFPECARNLVIAALEVDGMVVVDAALRAQGKVEIQESGRRRGAHSGLIAQGLLLPEMERDRAYGTVGLLVEAGDLHLEDVIGMGPRIDASVGKESDQSSLESAEAAFDLALGLGSWGDSVSDIEPAKSTLELAFGITVVVA